jgi:hypothetical protein
MDFLVPETSRTPSSQKRTETAIDNIVSMSHTPWSTRLIPELLFAYI